MKKQTKKLSLNKLTVRVLEPANKVVGGTGIRTTGCTANCTGDTGGC